VVAEPRGGHTHLGRAGAQSEEVLSDADRRAADQLCESLALLSKELRPIRGSEASVQADLRAPLGQGAENCLRRLAIGSVRDVSRPHASERGRAADDEPRRYE